MKKIPRLTDEQLAKIKRRRPSARASLACEGMYLTADEERLFEQMDAERLVSEDRVKRIKEYVLGRKKPASPALPVKKMLVP